MNLNKKAKDELRNLIEVRLKEVPEGNRICIDKELLEDLLFDSPFYDNELKLQVKTPVWSGKFLQKIDLSMVSFENVSWCISSCCGIEHLLNEDFSDDLGTLLDERNNQLGKIQYRPEYDHTIPFIIYSNTNAKIDFRKSWECKKFNNIYISNCDFSGTDLSKNDMGSNLTDGITILYSNFKNTGIKFVPTKKYDEKYNRYFDNVYIYFTNLENLDLSMFVVDFLEMEALGSFCYCDLRNTGIRIENFSKKSIDNPISTDYTCAGEFQEEIIRRFKDGEYDGCYINGVFIKSKEQREQVALEMKMKYTNFESEKFKAIIENIDDQITRMKK